MNNHLLIVDDLSINRDVLRNMFESKYSILEASSGEQAAALAREYEGKLALVLLDIRLPGISGLDILRMRKEGQILKDVPVIVITIADDPKTQLEAFKLGALDYINKPFVREIVEYRVANASLRTAYRELNEAAREKEQALLLAQQASEAKSRFLSRISHELRTPMNAIIGLTCLLKEKPADTDLLLDRLDASSRHLLSLLNEMMNISEIESGALQLHPTRLRLSAFLRSINAEVAVLARQRGLSFETFLPEELRQAEFLFDGPRLREALLYLIDNALKFTPEGGGVRCHAQRLPQAGDGNWVQFTVEDTGIGISPDFLPHVFDEFEVERETNTSGYGGVGLGLSICRSTVRLMGGQIHAESQPGKGSRFTVALPMHPAPKAADDPGKSAAERAGFAGKTLLLAEDNEINRMIAVRLLEKRNARVETVCDGQQAVERFAASPIGTFDAVLMDIRMPVMDGLDATRRIRALERPDAQAVPIIAMTANAYREDAEKSLAAGMNAHLSKPFEPDRLYQLLQELLDQRQA